MRPSRLSRPWRAARAAVVAIAVSAAPGIAQQPAASTGPVRGATVEGITQYTLANGLRVLLFPDQSKPQTTVNVTYLVGSRNEGYGETGMAHLLEHMMFKGAAHHLNPAAEITNHGAQFNASTEFDRTNFFETFAASDTTLAWALDLEADRMVNSFIARKDLESEFSVVRSEYEIGETNPLQVTLKRVLGSAYLFHAYGHMPIGARSDIENVPIDKLQAFYHRYYQPDNAIVTIAGDFDPTRALQLVEEKFGAIPRPTRALDSTYTVEPTQDGEREVFVRRTGNVQLMLAFYHVPGGAHPDFAAIDVLTRILGDSPNGRLYQALVATGKAAAVGAENLQQHDPGGLFTLVQLRKDQSLDSAKVAMLSAIQDLATTKPPTTEEVDRAKTAIVKDFDMALNRPSTLGLQLSEWMKIGDWRLFFVHRDRVKAVTPQDVQRVAAAYLKPSNRTLGYFIPTAQPDRAIIPPNPNVDSIVAHYRSTTVIAAGEAFDPSPANIESRLLRRTLASGMKLGLLSKKNRGEAVNAVITLHYGSERTLQDRSQIAAFTDMMLMRGTTAHTRQQIKDTLDRLQARMVVMPIVGGVRVNIETTRPNLPAVLRLAAEVLRDPSFDEKELAELKSQNLAAAEASRGEPGTLAQIALQQALLDYPRGHPRHVNSVDETIAGAKAVTAAELHRFHDEFFGANAGELVVVGDFDAPVVEQESRQLFGSWRSRESVAPLPEVLTPTVAATKVIETPDKANAVFMAGMNFRMQDTDPAYPAFLVADYLLGGSPLESRLAVRLRQKEGLSYQVQAASSTSPREPVTHWMAVAVSNPVNADKVQAGFADEVARALSAGFTADEVSKAKNVILQSRRVQRANDALLASTIDNELALGRTMQFDADLDARIAAVTPDAVNAALRQAIDPAKIVMIKAGDFARAKQAGDASKP